MKIKYLQGDKVIGKSNRKTNEFDCIEAFYIQNNNKYVENLWFVCCKEDGLTFWDSSYHLEFWPGHCNFSPRIRSLRAFRKYLKKVSKYLPNGTRVRLLSKYWKAETKEVYALEGKIKNNLTEDDSRRLIRAKMNVWLKESKEINREGEEQYS